LEDEKEIAVSKGARSFCG